MLGYCHLSLVCFLIRLLHTPQTQQQNLDHQRFLFSPFSTITSALISQTKHPSSQQVMLLKASRSGVRAVASSASSSPAKRFVCGAAVAPRSSAAAGAAARRLSAASSDSSSKQQGSALAAPAFGSIKRGMADSAAPPKATAAPAVATETEEQTAANNPLLAVSGWRWLCWLVVWERWWGAGMWRQNARVEVSGVCGCGRETQRAALALREVGCVCCVCPGTQ